MMLLDSVKLSDQKRLLKSKTREVYQHPDSPALLIKIHIDQKPAMGARGISAWLANKKDYFFYTSGIMRELQQIVASRYGAYDPIVEYIAPVYGVVDTDLGMGLLVAAMRDVEQELAPTVRRLFDEEAMTIERCDKLSAMLGTILQTPLVIGDLNQENIVLQNAEGPDEAFRLIDGLGERTLFPVQRWSRWASQRQKRRFVYKVRRRIDRVLSGEN